MECILRIYYHHNPRVALILAYSSVKHIQYMRSNRPISHLNKNEFDIYHSQVYTLMYHLHIHRNHCHYKMRHHYTDNLFSKLQFRNHTLHHSHIFGLDMHTHHTPNHSYMPLYVHLLNMPHNRSIRRQNTF